MPVPSRTNRAEAKYNVTTEFPHLGLHSAAATGNVGLVKYALSHGQPINSVLDGVLPLHAACSGGNDLVVRLLIEHGADVNAPRLPRRYSNDRNRDASAPIVGTSGSTPLHFAAANGHSTVVNTLLLHGAHADRPDKHGITPGMLARQNGWNESSDILHGWVLNKDRDLRERQGSSPEDATSSKDRVWYDVAANEGTTSKRLKVKRSIDNAFHILKPSLSSHYTPPSARHRALPDAPPSPTDKPLGEYSFYPIDPDFDPNDELEGRRPSLPHISTISPPPKTTSPSRRPNSADTDAESIPSPPPRRIGSKYSLMNLFKKSQESAPTPERHHSHPSSPMHTPASVPLPISAANSPSNPNATLSSSSPNTSSFSSRFRFRSASDLPAQVPLAVELHHQLSHQQHSTRERSGSGASIGVIEEHPSARNSPQTRPGILRTHKRSSSGQSTAQLPANSSYRALRFDPSSRSGSGNASPRYRTESNASRGLRESGSSSSLALAGSRPPGELNTNNSSASAADHHPANTTPESAPAVMTDFETVHVHVEEDEDEYGSPISRSEDTFDLMGLENKPRLDVCIDTRPRGRSFASSSSSLSPIASLDVSLPSAEFPFSINRPPQTPTDEYESSDHQLLTVPRPAAAGGGGGDCRVRGDSVSSQSTDGSNNLQLSLSGTTGTSGTSVTTPGILASPKHNLASPSLKPTELDHPPASAHFDEEEEEVEEGTALYPTENSNGIQGRRRPQAPLDINIRSISSHAQAEALVQAAQQSIFEMADQMPMVVGVGAGGGEEGPGSAGLSPGWTPLSAKLAAYGESLAIKRRLEEEEERERRERGGGEEHEEEGVKKEEVGGRNFTRSQSSEQERGKVYKHVISRQASLGFRPTGTVERDPRRPRTSGGDPPDEFSTNRAHDVIHRPSHSLSSQNSHLTTTAREQSSRARIPPHRPVVDYEKCQPPTPGSILDFDVELEFEDSAGGGSSPLKSGQERDIASATKLTRMGFSATPTLAVGSVPRSQGVVGKPRFGGLKSLMQTIKGKP